MIFQCLPDFLLSALERVSPFCRVALVGGLVRDHLLIRQGSLCVRPSSDIDLVVEGSVEEAVERLLGAIVEQLGESVYIVETNYPAYGSCSLKLSLTNAEARTYSVDISTARIESYPELALNPSVSPGALEDDLRRRDFTVNAIAFDLSKCSFIDPFNGRADIKAMRLSLLHMNSIAEDPTRVVRGCRYAARLGLQFSQEAKDQIQSTLQKWPWKWKLADNPDQVPEALGIRLRMELDLLFQREPWQEAIQILHQVGGLALLDRQLQQTNSWVRRLHWAKRLDVPLLLALVAGASDPLSLASRLKLPHRHCKLLLQLAELQFQLNQISSDSRSSPSWWTRFLEASGFSPEVVSLSITLGGPHWHEQLRWLCSWRHVRSPILARDLMQVEDLRPGPELGARLEALRFAALDQLPR